MFGIFAGQFAENMKSTNTSTPQYITIKGARVHNLKNIDLKIPRNQFIVITGVSGSGKSSLAFDTLYAEGQRRYVESLSSYARQFLGRIDKPEADYIKGIPPAIAIEQKVNTRNPRSTVGTSTEIYDYLKLLYARIGRTYSPLSGKDLQTFSFSNRFEADGITFEEPTQHTFSFNTPLGACPTCGGFGRIIGIDEDLVIPNKNLSIYNDAIACWRGDKMGEWKNLLIKNAHKFNFPIHKPYYEITP
jgi:excinuclease UvrABC ATPase subunit